MGEGNSAGPRWQGRRAPVLGRRRGRERGAVEVVGPRGAVADADAWGGRRRGFAVDRLGRAELLEG